MSTVAVAVEASGQVEEARLAGAVARVVAVLEAVPAPASLATELAEELAAWVAVPSEAGRHGAPEMVRLGVC